MGLDVNRPDSCTEAPAAALPVGKCKRAKVEAPPPEALPPMPSKEQQIVTDVVPTLDVDSLMPIAGAFRPTVTVATVASPANPVTAAPVGLAVEVKRMDSLDVPPPLSKSDSLGSAAPNSAKSRGTQQCGDDDNAQLFASQVFSEKRTMANQHVSQPEQSEGNG